MASLDEIFYKEFNQMMYGLKGMNGVLSIGDIPLPPDAKGKFLVEKHNKVAVNGITDEYYKKLNGSEAMLWSNGALERRKFDYKGNFMKGDDGNILKESVTLPQGCGAIISDIKLGVPVKYSSEEKFNYVDYTDVRLGNYIKRYFLYIVPKTYLYMMQQTALVLSWNKLQRFYSGAKIALQNGSFMYMFIIPYKPSSVQKNYRILHCKTTDDYSTEIKMLLDYWIKAGVMFNPNCCAMSEYVKGCTNMAYQPINGVLDIYERFDSNRPMAESEALEDVEFAEF